MEMQFLDLLVLVTMALGGLNVHPDPQAPRAAQVLRYAPEGADVFAYADAKALVPGVLDTLRSAPETELASLFPETQASLRRLPAKIHKARAFVRFNLGFDPVDDLHWVAAWVKLHDGGKSYLVAIAGAPESAVEHVAQGGERQVTQLDGHPILRDSDGSFALGMPAKGVLLLGTTAWVEAALRKSWHPTKPSALSAAAVAKGAVAAVVYRPGEKFLRDLQEQLPAKDEPVARALLDEVQEAALTFTAKGIRWSVKTRTDQGYRLAELASDGLVDLLGAGQPLSRAAARWGVMQLATLSNDSSQRDAVLAHSEGLIKVLVRFASHSKIRFQRKGAPKRHTLQVSAMAQHLHEVIPMLAIGVSEEMDSNFWMLVSASETAKATRTSR